MLTLDQVRLLENKVEQAVERIRVLTDTNEALEARIAKSNARIVELESMVSAFKNDQDRIESGILSALSKLSDFEDAVLSNTEQPAAQQSQPVDYAQQTTEIPRQDNVPVHDTHQVQEPYEQNDTTAVQNEPSFDFDTKSQAEPDSIIQDDDAGQELSFDESADDDADSVDIPEIF